MVAVKNDRIASPPATTIDLGLLLPSVEMRDRADLATWQIDDSKAVSFRHLRKIGRIMEKY